MYFITFSRKMGTSGSEIARRVAEQLGYNFYDTEAIEETAREMGFLKEVKEIDEKVPSLFLRSFSQNPEVHLDRLYSVIYELASRGSAVFLGRGSHILLRTFKCALHIWDNPELYDIVLNTDNLTLDLVVNTVLQIAGSEKIKARSVDAMRSLEMMGLAKRAEAALIEAGLKNGASISVLEPGKIQLTGLVREESDKILAENILKGVQGIKLIDNQIQVYYRDGGA